MDEKKLSAAEIVQIYCGNYGFWQLRSFFVVAMVKVPSAWQLASILFTALKPNDFWCTPPAELSHIEVRLWKNLSHRKTIDPVTGQKSMNPCFIYDFNYTEMFDRSAILPLIDDIPLLRCTRFTYDSVLTITTTWDLVCDREFLISVSQTFFLFGMFVGVAFSPYLLTKYGPRRVMIIAMIFQIVLGVMAAYATLLEIRFALRFLVACCCSNMVAAGYMICLGIVHSTAKTVLHCCFEHFSSLGIITLTIWAYFLPNWIELTIGLSIPTFIILLFFKWIPDSPIWLLENGKYSQAKDLLESAAKLNNQEVPDLDFEKCLESSTGKNSSWLQLFKENNFFELSSLHVCWGLTSLSYYGFIPNIKSLGRHLKTNTILTGFAEIFGVWLGIVLIFKARRKWFFLGLILIISGLATGLCLFLPRHSYNESQAEIIRVCLAIPQRVAMTAALTLLLVTSANEFEECFRNILIYSCVVFSRVLMMLAPVADAIVFYGNNITLAAYGASSVCVGIFILTFTFVRYRRSRHYHPDDPGNY